METTWLYRYRDARDITERPSISKPYTVEPVNNDHLYNAIDFLFLI